ncbi:MAG: FtsX-like permease family protein, partial [Bacteroidota bacterium]
DQDFKASSTTGYLNLQPLLDIHLNDTISAPKAVMGSYQTVYFFAIIGLVTLLTAFVNYVNLTTARALDRAREVGVRKVIGAQRVQLIAQFLSESAVTIFLALVLAVAMAFVFSPVVQDWTGITFANTLWTEPYLWLTLLALFCISTLMAGLYPSLMLSSFKPAEVLKGTSGRFRVGIPIRQGLVVFQFTTSFVLLVGAFVVHLQLHYILNMNVGIGLEQVITVPSPRVLPGKSTRADAIETFTQQLHQLPGIQQTATSHELPGQGFNLNTDHARRVEAIPSSNVPASAVWIDDSFARLYGLKLLAGPGFKDISLEAADQEPFPIMANETAIKSLGFDSPMHALDQRIDLANGNLCYIVGVFKDFNWSSAHKQRENVFFFLGAGLSHISIKATTENLPQTISDIEKTYKQLFPGNPFQYAFADETFKAQYGNEQRFAKLFNLFVALAIFIAGLGLFGLTTFTVQQRKVEVGIRKVLGATLASVVLLLSRDLLKLVIAGFLIAVPIAWYVMSSWLEDFAYRIEVGMGVFLLAGAVTVLIALITLSFKSIKAALANPVDSLRNE